MWGLRLGKGSLTHGQPQPQPQAELQSSGQERVSPECTQKGRMKVVLPQPLFWGRPISGSLSCFLPDSPPLRHGVASPMSQGIILPVTHDWGPQTKA